jgi:putative transposase
MGQRLNGRQASRQCAFRFCTWGGARAGAGRKPKGARAGVSHRPRPVHAKSHPLHVTLRVRRGLRPLRAHELFVEVRRALAAGRERFGFRLVHFSVQRDHLHLLAEAANRRALSRGVQGLAVRVARAINRRLQRRGKVFADRYHARALKTPRAARWALRYVLLNVRKHEPRAVPFGFVDGCSSAAWFNGFARPAELVFGARHCREEFRARCALD